MQFDTDFILRQIETFLKLKDDILQKVEIGKLQDADLLIQRCYKESVGLSHIMADYLEPQEIIDLVNLTGNNWVKIGACAHLLLMQADLSIRTGRENDAARQGKKAYLLMKSAADNIDEKQNIHGFYEMAPFSAYAGD